MLRCTALRLRSLGALVLAVSPDGCGPELAADLGVPGVPTVDQGGGDLGRRLTNVWRALGEDRPVAFFGGDAPDVPAAALAEIAPSLQAADVALGPTADGGYWTLAARRLERTLLASIDWGTARVYDQTLQRAARAGLDVGVLPRWHDVDRPEDVEGLRRRLARLPPPSVGEGPDVVHLRWLARQLERPTLPANLWPETP